ncbi:MAG: LuxR C-terminal-related transcriptional regulator [Chloroflexota bacterium]|nr:LuxR C-terminal-related transcriptional regulator [Chloroflexota bacterium]MDQ5864981.1 LuxR C-terminal-related transcriptional regulator [Chloroflexota bacterium]
MTEEPFLNDSARGTVSQAPILATKLHIPQVRASFVSRPQLVARLRMAVHHKLTLLTAPAGSGKTQLLAQWLYDSETHSPAPGTRAAWVSLDEADNDIVRFLTYVVAALDRLQPGLANQVMPLLHTSLLHTVEAPLVPLINLLDTVEATLVLVLDDYHEISAQPVHEALTFLLEHLPRNTHIVVSSRAEPPLPLARLRARNELLEIGVSDLRFTQEEVGEFMSRVMGLELATAQVEALQERTEGWIAGLQLAALAMQNRADRDLFISGLSSAHRYFLEYLVEEVLQKQPEDIQTFLLYTSILDSLSGPLCDELTGRQDSQRVLAALERQNLFTVALDHEGRWYRYHTLFGEVLRNQLERTQPHRATELHRSASLWYERANMVTEAIEHALVSEPDLAGRLIRRSFLNQLGRGEIATVKRWLETLPEQQVRADPGLAVSRAWVSLFTNDPTSAEWWVAQSERSLAAQDDLDVAERNDTFGEIVALRARLAVLRRDVAGAVRLCEQALAYLPSMSAGVKGVICYSLGRAQYVVGDTQAARSAIQEAVTYAEKAGDMLLHLYALYSLGEMEEAQGRLHDAQATFARILSILTSHIGAEASRSPLASLAHLGIGKLMREWNRLEQASEHLTTAIDLVRKGSIDESIAIDASLELALVLRAQGEYDAALGWLQYTDEVARNLKMDWAVTTAAAYKATVLLDQGKPEEAARWGREALQSAEQEPEKPETERIALARLLLAQSRRQSQGPYLQQASTVLQHLRDSVRAAGRHGRLIEVLVLQAMCLYMQRDEAAARDALLKALALAEPEGYVRIFADEGQPMAELLLGLRKLGSVDLGDSTERKPSGKYLAGLISALGHVGHVGHVERTGRMRHAERPLSGSSQNRALVEPLSEREIEVLQLVALGLKNEEVAERLIVSLGTVKTHINNIYGKLGVRNRVEAVTLARELSLLVASN